MTLLKLENDFFELLNSLAIHLEKKKYPRAIIIFNENVLLQLRDKLPIDNRGMVALHMDTLNCQSEFFNILVNSLINLFIFFNYFIS